jgi:fibronectin type 3 domain-containing protein
MQALENSALEGDIVAIEDVPNDQGKQVRIVWNKFVDDGIATDPVDKYIVKRDDGDDTWTTVGEASADASARYALVVPTLYDSTAAGDALTTFMVVSVSKGGMVYESAAAEGYSVDNLAPSVPGKFEGTLAANSVQLSWEEVPDADFRYYALYRSTNSGFTPDETSLYATTTDLSYLDNDVAGSSTYYYRLSAVDFNGNEGEATPELAVSVTSIANAGSNVPTVFSLDQNYPNPFNPTTTIRFGLPQAASVKIVIYNVLGEPVRTLTENAYAAGYHHVVWDGRNDRGQIVSAGMYLYRIDAGSFVKTNKMLMIK